VEKEGYKTKVMRVEVKFKQPTVLRVELEKEVVLPKTTTTTGPVRNEMNEKTTSPQYDHAKKATSPLVNFNLTTVPKTEIVEPEIRPLKHYSSLTQLDHSFLNLFRGVQQRNSGYRFIPNFICITITVISLMRFPLYV